MLPIALDLTELKTAIIGGGAQAEKRLQMVLDASATHVTVYVPEPSEMSDSYRQLAGDRLQARLPEAAEIAELALVFAANLTEQDAAYITETGRAHKVLVNVEDVKPQCDFHVPAIIRRGALVFAVSTGGKSPALARRMKDFLSQRFPENWSRWIEEIGSARDDWRQQGKGFSDVTRLTNELIDEKGWLDCQCPLQKQKI